MMQHEQNLFNDTLREKYRIHLIQKLAKIESWLFLV